MPLRAWSSSRYAIPLPPGHRFPIAKYAMLRDLVVRDGVVRPEQVHEPARIGIDDLRLVHAPEYIEQFTAGDLGIEEQRRLGFPWSPALVERSFRAVGGTCEAAEAALEHGVAINLAGGTHHAFADHGEGFCVFNDVAVAIRRLMRDGRIGRAAVIDLDVHQGNGTHAIFADDARVFTFSMHGARNYPFHRVPGSMDVELPDDTGDEAYLAALADALPRVLAAARPELVAYLAGADPHVGDRLGRLAMSVEGLARRDTLVLEACREVGIPVVVTIAGGYGIDIADTVRVHANTVRIARAFV